MRSQQKRVPTTKGTQTSIFNCAWAQTIQDFSEMQSLEQKLTSSQETCGQDAGPQQSQIPHVFGVQI